MSLSSRPAARERQLPIVAAALLNNDSLQSLASKLHRSAGEAYALASTYCAEVFGETVGEVAPRMAADRLQALEARQAEFHQRRIIREQIKFLEAFSYDLECAQEESRARA